jgi:signal peptidase I
MEEKSRIYDSEIDHNEDKSFDIEEQITDKNQYQDKKEEARIDKETNYVKEMREMLFYFAAVIIIVLLIHQFVGQQIEVSGSSMESTLHNEDHLILEKVSYQLGEPERFDIVVFRPYAIDKDVYYIKRVIGLPGETIQIIGSDIYINGEVLEENYGNNPIIDGGVARNIIELEADEYFLLGDNRNNSKDSRDPSIGAVHGDTILGRAWLRIWPFQDFGVLEHQ